LQQPDPQALFKGFDTATYGGRRRVQALCRGAESLGFDHRHEYIEFIHRKSRLQLGCAQKRQISVASGVFQQIRSYIAIVAQTAKVL
jgi:hypothetical protein